MAKKRYGKKENIMLSDALKLIAIGLLLGTVFTFGVPFWRATVTRADCTVVETCFVGYDYRRGHHGRMMHFGERLSVACGNGEQYRFDGVSISKELLDALVQLTPQEEITLLLHPNTDTVMELVTDDGLLLGFEDTMKDMEGEATVFTWMGIIMYASALYGVYWAVQILRRK